VDSLLRLAFPYCSGRATINGCGKRAQRYPRKRSVAKHPMQKADPSPEEIQALTAEIRQGWSKAEALSRFVGPVPWWTCPVVSADDDGREAQ